MVFILLYLHLFGLWIKSTLDVILPPVGDAPASIVDRGTVCEQPVLKENGLLSFNTLRLPPLVSMPHGHLSLKPCTSDSELTNALCVPVCEGFCDFTDPPLRVSLPLSQPRSTRTISPPCYTPKFLVVLSLCHSCPTGIRPALPPVCRWGRPHLDGLSPEPGCAFCPLSSPHTCGPGIMSPHADVPHMPPSGDALRRGGVGVAPVTALAVLTRPSSPFPDPLLQNLPLALPCPVPISHPSSRPLRAPSHARATHLISSPVDAWHPVLSPGALGEALP